MIIMVNYEDVKEFWDYLEFYPEEDDEDFDGVHYGGIKGIRPDAPYEAKLAFQEYMKDVNSGIKV